MKTKTIIVELPSSTLEPEGYRVQGCDGFGAIVTGPLDVRILPDAQPSGQEAAGSVSVRFEGYERRVSFYENYKAPLPQGDHVVYAAHSPAAVEPCREQIIEAIEYCENGEWSNAVDVLRRILDSKPASKETSDNLNLGDSVRKDGVEAAAIDMILYCPNCGVQHVDGADGRFLSGEFTCPDDSSKTWDNPPHRSHLCHDCGCIWRPADVATNGVAEIKTEGKADTWPVNAEEITAASASKPAVESGGDGWRQIESAPRDGSVIVVTGLEFGVGPTRFYIEAEWMDGHFYDVNDADKDMLATSYLTHWQRLPPAPTAARPERK